MEYGNLSGLVYPAAGLFVATWFLHEIIDVIRLFFAGFITVVISLPVTRMQKKKVSRNAARLFVYFDEQTVIACMGCLAGGLLFHRYCDTLQ